MNKEFKEGVKSSLPIVAAYFSVSFTFGIMAANFGLSPFVAGLISMTNLTSAGQFAGINLIVESATLIEMMMVQLVINLRYSLMSLTLTQKLARGISPLTKMAMSFAITDEIFATAATKEGYVTPIYMLGLSIGPYFSWALGTITGAIANNLLPLSVQNALGLALYAMFIAIVVPAAVDSKPVTTVVVITVILSLLMSYAPVLSSVSSGFSIIICTILASFIGAVFFPIEPSKQEVSK